MTAMDRIPNFFAAVNEKSYSKEVVFLQNLKKLRLAAGLRQIDVAKKMNVDQGCVSKWENGETRPSRKYHKKLARLYGVTVDDLLKEDAENVSIPQPH